MHRPTHVLFDVLYEERRTPHVVNREVEEPLQLLDVQVHGDEVRHACLGEHGGQELGRDATSLAHLALLGVGEERNDP